MNLVERVQAMAAKAKEKAEENRRRMPTVAAITDEFKDVFGADQVKVTFASENGITLGTLDKSVGVKVSDMVLINTEKEAERKARK